MTATFTNFEAYAEAIQDADLDVRLLHPYQRCWSIQQRELGNLRLQHGIEGSGLLTRGAVNADGWAFYVQRSGDPVPLNGKLLIDNTIAVLPPRCEFRFSGQGRIEWYSLYVPNASLAPPHNMPVDMSSAGVIAVDGQLFSRIRSALEAAFAVASSKSSATSSECVAAALHDNILFAFRQLFEKSADSRRSFERKADVNRKTLISQVIELINDTSAWELSVPELASVVGVSQRTLLSAFREQLGMPPQTYLIIHRHHLARRLLIKSAPDSTTVAAVAAKFGFYDPGRFAGRYLRIFGEHPSETLRRGS